MTKMLGDACYKLGPNGRAVAYIYQGLWRPPPASRGYPLYPGGNLLVWDFWVAASSAEWNRALGQCS